MSSRAMWFWTTGTMVLFCCACSPNSQAAQGAGMQSAAGACAATSCAAAPAGTVASAGAASTLPPATASNVVSRPAAGTAAPPTVANQAGRVAPPSLPMSGSSASTLAGRPAVQPPVMAMSGAAAGSGAPATAAPATADAALAGVTPDELEMLRNACVDGINMYRAMVANLKPLKRATAAQETCGEQGAQMDGDAMSPHMSARAGLCARMGLFSENTCGGFPGGNAMAIANSLKFCLQGFWAEGEPPGSREMCMMDLQGCYEQHGHYINMTDANIGSVACAFYKMKDGSYWLNHDFGR